MAFSAPAAAMRPRRARPTKAFAVVALAAALAALALPAAEPDTAFGQGWFRRSKPKPRMKVVLVKEHWKLGQPGDVVTVKKGYFRNELLPGGIAVRRGGDIEAVLKKKEEEAKAAEQAMMDEAVENKKKVEAVGKLVFEKKVREDGVQIFGSLTAANVAQEIVVKSGVPVRLTSVNIPEVNKLGEFTATIDLAPEVVATVDFEVVAEGGSESG